MRNRNKEYATTSAHVLSGLIPPVATLATMLLAHNGIQEVRALDASAAKDLAKNNFARISSTVGLLMAIWSALQLGNYLYETGAFSRMNRKDKAVICCLAMAGILAEIWPVVRFGAENTTFWTGISAASSASFFNLAHGIAAQIDRKNYLHDMEYLPISYGY